MAGRIAALPFFMRCRMPKENLLTDAELSLLQELDASVSPRPWTAAQPHPDRSGHVATITSPNGRMAKGRELVAYIGPTMTAANRKKSSKTTGHFKVADFIVQMRNALPALIREIALHRARRKTTLERLGALRMKIEVGNRADLLTAIDGIIDGFAADLD